MPSSMNGFLDEVYWDNSVRQYLVAALTMVAIIAAVYLFRGVIVARIRHLADKTDTQIDDTLLKVAANTRMWIFAIVGLAAGSGMLELPSSVENAMPKIAATLFFIQVGIWVSCFIAESVRHYHMRKQDSGETETLPTINIVGVSARIATWVVVTLLILANFGVDVTALITGLGIGGIAVALAVQKVLSDLLASVTIVLDKPFEVGDFIVVGELLGTVETIGVKTTRVTSLGGECLVFPNSDLVNSRLRNYKHLRERRVVFDVGVVYQTPAAVVRDIPALLQAAVEGQNQTFRGEASDAPTDSSASAESDEAAADKATPDKATPDKATPDKATIDEADMPLIRFDRAHFKVYADSALKFEVVYYVLTPDYNVYMDIQQAVNFAIMDAFQARSIDFAYPTRTLYMHAEERAPSAVTGEAKQ